MRAISTPRIRHMLRQACSLALAGIVLLAAVTMDTLQTRAAANAAQKVTGQAPAETKEEAAK